MQNLLYITIDKPYTGIGRYATDMNKLTDYDILQIVFKKESEDQYYKLRINGKFKSQFMNYVDYFHYKSRMDKIRINYKMLHIVSQTVNPFIMPKDIKKIVTIHDMIPFKIKNKNDYKYGTVMRFFIKKYVKYDNIISVSNHVKNDIINHFNVDGKNVTVIYPAVSEFFFNIPNKEQLRMELGLPIKKKLILSISSNDKRKNLITVEKVMSKIGHFIPLNSKNGYLNSYILGLIEKL